MKFNVSSQVNLPLPILTWCCESEMGSLWRGEIATGGRRGRGYEIKHTMTVIPLTVIPIVHIVIHVCMYVWIPGCLLSESQCILAWGTSSARSPNDQTSIYRLNSATWAMAIHAGYMYMYVIDP